MRESDAVALFSFFCCLFSIGFALGITTFQCVNNGEPPLSSGSIVCAIANCTKGVVGYILSHVNTRYAHNCVFCVIKYVDFLADVCKKFFLCAWIKKTRI